MWNVRELTEPERRLEAQNQARAETAGTRVLASFSLEGWYSFSMAAVTKYHKLSYLLFTQIYGFPVLQLGSLRSRCQQGCVSSGGSRGQSDPCLFQLQGASHIPWLLAPNLIPFSFSASVVISPSISDSDPHPLSLSLKNPWDYMVHFKTLSLITYSLVA